MRLRRIPIRRPAASQPSASAEQDRHGQVAQSLALLPGGLLLFAPVPAPHAATSSMVESCPTTRRTRVDAVDLGGVKLLAARERSKPLPSGNPLWSVPLSAQTATQERPIFSASGVRRSAQWWRRPRNSRYPFRRRRRSRKLRRWRQLAPWSTPTPLPSSRSRQSDNCPLAAGRQPCRLVAELGSRARSHAEEGRPDRNSRAQERRGNAGPAGVNGDRRRRDRRVVRSLHPPLDSEERRARRALISVGQSPVSLPAHPNSPLNGGCPAARLRRVGECGLDLGSASGRDEERRPW